jgi:hypothetical protein
VTIFGVISSEGGDETPTRARKFVFVVFGLGVSASHSIRGNSHSDTQTSLLFIGLSPDSIRRVRPLLYLLRVFRFAPSVLPLVKHFHKIVVGNFLRREEAGM